MFRNTKKNILLFHINTSMRRYFFSLSKKKKKKKLMLLYCNYLNYSSFLSRSFLNREIYFISTITQCAVYPIIFLRRTRRCPVFRWRGSRTAWRTDAETSHVPFFPPNSGAETSYDFAKLETPWRESRERRNPPSSPPPPVKNPSPIPILFPPDGLSFLPRRSFHAKSYFSSARKRKALRCK